MMSNVTDNGSVVVTDGPFFDAVEADALGIYTYPFVFVIIYMIVGTVGNSIVIYIFTMQWKLTKTTVFILTLAGVDIMSCLVNMPVEAAILYHPLNFDLDALCKLTRFTTFIASASSSFVLVAISIDRYLMVCRPFLGRELGVQYAKKTCLVAVLLGVFSTWPSLIFYGTYTFHVNMPDKDTGVTYKVEGRTCLISNYYVEHDKLPAGFYFFLFGGHVIMFLILTMVYIMIGRRLFMSTNPDIPQEKRHSLKYFGISMMSAITGSIPNTPTEGGGRDKRSSLGSKSSRAVSLDNINRISMENVHRIDPALFQNSGTGPSSSPHARISTETAVSIIVNDNEVPGENDDGTLGIPAKNNNHVTENGHVITGNSNTNYVEDIDIVCNSDTPSVEACNQIENSSAEGDGGREEVECSGFRIKPEQSTTLRTPSADNSTNKRNPRLCLDIHPHRDLNGGGHFQRSNERLSSESVGSDKSLTPMSPDSVRGILLRSRSIENRSQLNRIISDELQHNEVKGFSLRRNTLMMRMVTIAFIISFLPYLVIVTLRYSDPNIPLQLNKASQIAYHVFLRTYFINSMINPFIYGFMNIEFRTKLKNLFCRACTKPSNIPL